MAGKLWTTRLVFALSGVGIAAWALIVPYAKIKFHLSDGELGSVLFLSGIGGLSVAFLAGLVVTRWGSRTSTVLMLIFMCLLLPALVVSPTVGIFTILLFLASAVFGILDVAINAQGGIIEARSGQLRMSGFHASFSIGTLAMALIASILLKAGGTLELICWLCVAVIMLGLTQSFRLLPKHYDSLETGKKFVAPNFRAIVLGLCCFAVFMSDGAITDWSTVFLHFNRHMPISGAVLGYAAFMVATVLTRLTGDRVTAKIGQIKIIKLGVLLALLGFVFVVFVPVGIVGVLGFCLIGLGSGNITPLVFSAASRVPGMAAHHSMPAVVGIGYIGFLAGPVMIGLVSSYFSLEAALGVDAVLLGAIFFATRYVV